MPGKILLHDLQSRLCLQLSTTLQSKVSTGRMSTSTNLCLNVISQRKEGTCVLFTLW